MQVDTTIYPDFVWNDRLLGKSGAQSFWLFLENTKESQIVYQERIVFSKTKVCCNLNDSICILGCESRAAAPHLYYPYKRPPTDRSVPTSPSQ